MASGEVVIQSMWSPAVTAVRTRGIACEFVPLKEGYRGWGVTLVPLKHLTGLKLDAAMEYLNWYNSGWQGAFIARQGYYGTVPETTKASWSHTSGITGTRASRRRRTSRIRSASSWRRPATSATAARFGIAWAMSRSGTAHGRAALPDKRWNEFISA